jgi:hypothetical protein
MSIFPRDLAPSVARIARNVYASGGTWGRPPVETNQAKTARAPATGESVALSNAPIVPGTLELARSDGHAYLPGVDYAETPTGFQNLRIPSGEPLTAEYAAEEEPEPAYRFEGSLVRAYTDPVTGETVVRIEPKTEEPEAWKGAALENLWTNVASYNPAGYYRHQGTVYLRGRISGGAVAVGTTLFAVPAGYRPANTESLPAHSDAGPVQIEVSPAGVVSIGDGPFEAGSGWLSFDGLSFRALTGYGARYPGQNRYPNTNRYPNGG